MSYGQRKGIRGSFKVGLVMTILGVVAFAITGDPVTTFFWVMIGLLVGSLVVP